MKLTKTEPSVVIADDGSVTRLALCMLLNEHRFKVVEPTGDCLKLKRQG